MFHRVCGRGIALTNHYTTARREHAGSEYDNGVVFSADPLADGQLFEINLDQVHRGWLGSIGIGVTKFDPSSGQQIASTTQSLGQGTVVASGKEVFLDGVSVQNISTNLNELSDGSRVGVSVLRGQMHLFVDGADQGVIRRGIDPPVRAVVDVYGCCVQVSVTSSTRQNAPNMPVPGSLAFSLLCGPAVHLSSNRCSAVCAVERRSATSAVLFSNRPLRNDELFEIRVDNIASNSRGFAIGVTVLACERQEDLPVHARRLDTDTWLMAGKRITFGKGTTANVTASYPDAYMDNLKVGDAVGVLRCTNGDLHIFVNGQDLGVGASGVPDSVHAVIDLANQVSGISLTSQCGVQRAIQPSHNVQLCSSVDPLEFHRCCGQQAQLLNGNRTARRKDPLKDFNYSVVLSSRPLDDDQLFEIQIDQVVDKWSGSLEIGVTAHSPERLVFPATMTNIPTGTWMMSKNTVMVNGVRTRDDYGCGLFSLKEGDHVGVMRRSNGNLHCFVNGRDCGVAVSSVPRDVYAVVDLYGQTAQVSIHSSGVVSNSAGASANPATGMIYPPIRFHERCGRNARIKSDGRVALREDASSEFNSAVVLSDRMLQAGELFEVRLEKHVEMWSGSLELGVTRIHPTSLEHPETMTDITHDTWMLSGSSIMQDGHTVKPDYPVDLDSFAVGQRVGVVRYQNGDLHFLVDGQDQGKAASDVPEDVFGVVDLYGQSAQVSLCASGPATSAASQSGGTIASSAAEFISSLSESSSETSIATSGSGESDDSDIASEAETEEELLRHATYNPLQSTTNSTSAASAIQVVETTRSESASVTSKLRDTDSDFHQFHLCCGKNISLCNSRHTATRTAGYNHAVMYSSEPLRPDQPFEVELNLLAGKWAGTLTIGVTTRLPESSAQVPPNSLKMVGNTWLLSDSSIYHNSNKVQENYTSSLERLQEHDRLGVSCHSDGTLHFLINGCDLGPVTAGITEDVYAVVDVYGKARKVTITSRRAPNNDQTEGTATQGETSAEEADVSLESLLRFHQVCGKNVVIDTESGVATRRQSFNHGLVFTNRPLRDDEVFEVEIESVNAKWSGTLSMGVTTQQPACLAKPLPKTSLELPTKSWLMSTTSIFVNGKKVREQPARSRVPATQVLHYSTGQAVNLNQATTQGGGRSSGAALKPSDRLAVVCRGGQLVMSVNGTELESSCSGVPAQCYGVIDLYGAVQQVRLVSGDNDEDNRHKPPDELATESFLAISRGLPDDQVRSACPFWNRCRVFKDSLMIPDPYFDPRFDQCFCDNCHKGRGDEPYYMRGEPPSLYAVPIGWCRFALRLHPRSVDVHRVFEKWHVAFHGTQVGAVRAILDTGYLLLPGDIALGGHQLRELPGHFTDNWKPAGFDTKKVFVSPTIRYAGLNAYSRPEPFKDQGRERKVRVAFQVCIRPGSYHIGPQTVGATQPLDPQLPNSKLEWSSKERGALELYGLMVKIE